jgi:bacterioferritin-associated ferredoxin
MSGLQQKYWVFHEISVGATCTKCATYKEQAAEFFEEANALNTEAVILDQKKRILEGYV